MSLLNGGRSYPLAAPTVEQAGSRSPLVASLPLQPAHYKGQKLNRCRLCGAPALSLYCAGHSWAFGDPEA